MPAIITAPSTTKIRYPVAIPLPREVIMAATVWRGAPVGNRGTHCIAMRETTVPVELLTGRRRFA